MDFKNDLSIVCPPIAITNAGEPAAARNLRASEWLTGYFNVGRNPHCHYAHWKLVFGSSIENKLTCAGQDTIENEIDFGDKNLMIMKAVSVRACPAGAWE